MTKFFSLTPIVIFLLLSGCATKKPKKVEGPKTYNQAVEDEFSSIENSQKDVLDYYRRLRQQNWQDYKESGKKGNVPYRVWQRRNRPKPQPRAPKKLAPIPQPKPLAASIVEEMKIEIRQYMSYFCMGNRKSSRFSDRADCTAFTENALRECEDKYPVIINRDLVKCVRGKLN